MRLLFITDRTVGKTTLKKVQIMSVGDGFSMCT